jgi:hypothetical protein
MTPEELSERLWRFAARVGKVHSEPAPMTNCQCTMPNEKCCRRESSPFRHKQQILKRVQRAAELDLLTSDGIRNHGFIEHFGIEARMTAEELSRFAARVGKVHSEPATSRPNAQCPMRNAAAESPRPLGTNSKTCVETR